MGLNSQVIERKVEHFLNTIFKSERSSNKTEIQKRKFMILSKLVADLFDNKNSKVCFNNISNLIILILNIYNEKFPIDIYSTEKEKLDKKTHSNFKRILKKEFMMK